MMEAKFAPSPATDASVLQFVFTLKRKLSPKNITIEILQTDG